MALHDSNPERRNLTVLSMSIILYYLAGGQVMDSVVRVQVVNVTFRNPEILAFFVWLLLAWFCFRYWLTNKETWKKPLISELTSRDTCQPIYYNHLVKRFGLSDNYESSYHENSHWVKLADSQSKLVRFQHIYKEESGKQKSDYADIETLADRIVVLRCIVEMFFRQPTLSGYFVPYFLFLWALALGLVSAL